MFLRQFDGRKPQGLGGGALAGRDQLREPLTLQSGRFGRGGGTLQRLHQHSSRKLMIGFWLVRAAFQIVGPIGSQ